MASITTILLLILGYLSSTCYGQLLFLNTTAVQTTPSTTTLPPNPGAIFFIIIPISILVGIPLFIALFCCLTAMCSCLHKRKESLANSRRVSPVNDPEKHTSPGTEVSEFQDHDMFAYDGNYASSNNNNGGYEAQAQYNYGWDF